MLDLANSVGTIRNKPEAHWCDKVMHAALQHLRVFPHHGLVTGLNLYVSEGPNIARSEYE